MKYKIKNLKENKKTIYKIMIISIIFIVLIIVSSAVVTNHGEKFNSIVKTDELKGQWCVDEVTSFTFDGKGKGILHTDIGEYCFDYVLEDNAIIMEFNSEEIGNPKYTYEVIDNQLVLNSLDKQYMLVKE